MKRMKWIAALLVVASIAMLVGPVLMQRPDVRAATPIAGAYTAKAGTAGVTSGLFVKLSSAGVIVTATAVSDSVVGVCELTAAENALTRYAPMGTRATVTSGETIAVGNLLTAGTGGKAFVLDTDDATTQRWAAVALTAASGADEDVTVILQSGTAEQRLALPSLAVGGGFGDTGTTVSAAGVIQTDGALTSSGAVTGGTITDGTLTSTAGTVTGGVSITSTTFTDGTATLTGGNITGAGSIAATTLTGTTVTDGTLSSTGGTVTGGVSITSTTFTDGTLTITGGDITAGGSFTATTFTDGTATLTAGAVTGVLDISGATVTYRSIINADINAAAAIARSKLAEDALAVYGIPFTALRNSAGLALVAAAEDNEFGLTSAGFGTGTLVIDGDPSSGESETQTLMFEFVLPPEYVAAGDVHLVVTAQESVGAATVATTISAEAYESDGEGGVSANLYNAFDNTDVVFGSWTTCTSVITPANLVAGDRLIIFVRIVTNDTGATVGTVAQIGKVQLQIDVQG